MHAFGVEQEMEKKESNDAQVSLSTCAEYFHKYLFSGTSRHALDHYIEELDIDCNLKISEGDITAMLEKYRYFEEIFLAPSCNTRDFAVLNSFKEKGTISLNTKALNPFKQL